ncbi:hypothetical protein R6Z07M_005829 [Ovis aries]
MVCPGGLDAPKWLPGDPKFGPRDPDLLHNNNKTSALAAGAPTLVPALLPPAAASAAPGSEPRLPCPRGRAESRPRPSANFSSCHRAASRDPGPDPGRRRSAGRVRPPRRTLGQTVRSLAVLGRGGQRWQDPRPSLSPEPGGARQSPDLAGETAPTAGPPDLAAAAAHHPRYLQWPLYRPMTDLDKEY